MAVLSTTNKTRLGMKAATQAVKNPGVLRAGGRAAKPAGRLAFTAGKPYAKRQARKRVERLGEAVEGLGEAARTVGVMLVTYGPQAAQELGLIEAPKPKRTAPRVVVGIVIGAAAVYFLEPDSGRAHREQVLRLVS